MSVHKIIVFPIYDSSSFSLPLCIPSATIFSSISPMAAKAYSLTIIFSLVILSTLAPVFPATFTFVNQCGYTVWPGLLSNAGTAQLPTTGFALNSGDSFPVSAPASWSGRMWGRSLCSQDSTGKFACLTGDCGSGAVECVGGGAAPPATLAEFTLSGSGGLDFYDVSLVDGYNLPMLVTPQGGAGGNCTITGCVADLNLACPSELKVVSAGGGGGGVACRSACEAFGEPKYCCSGEFAMPDTCRPSSYSEVFKSACPRAYSYAYDDGTSTFTCSSADYVITFCPSPSTSEKKASATSSGLSVSNGGDLRLKPVNFCRILVIFIAAAAMLQIWRFN